jgi:hypothetical protein
MKDFLGTEIVVGSKVVFTAPNYRHFAKATVIKLTPKQVVVEYNNTWNYGAAGMIQTHRAEPTALIVIKDNPCKHNNKVYGGFSGSLWQCTDCGDKG